MESVTDVVGAVQGTHKWMYSQPTGLWECYDLAADPRELRNLCDSRPDLLRKGQAHVSAYMQRGAEHHAAVAVPVAASVSRDTDLAHANPRVRAAAVQAMVPSAGPVAVAALQEQWANDRSPTVRAAILRTLLEVDRAAAIEALKDETVARRLSDYERVRIIASAQAVEALPHLLDLFREYGDSKQFRRQILKAIVRVQPSVPHRRELLTELRRSVFEPELRAELTELIGAQR